MTQRLLFAVVLLVFFLSGAAALVYEVLWMRWLALIFGVTTYATATVLATFMGGLALGSWVFGRWIDGRGHPLRVYALLEVGIGLYALAVPGIFVGLRPAFVALHDLGLSATAFALGRALLAAAVLLLPTFLMGGTLPILVRFLVRRREDVGRGSGLLYFANTAGAVAGCLVAGFFLIEAVGLRGATWIAALTNFAVAGVALGIDRLHGEVAEPAGGEEAHAFVVTSPPAHRRLALWCITLSGFASLAYEVLWTRALLRYLYNSTYAFTTMLSTFLAGIALGSALYSVFAGRIRRPLLVFAGLQVGVGVGFATSGLLFADLAELSAALVGGERITSFVDAMQAMFAGSVLILFLPTLFLGASLPLATSICTRSMGTLGQGLGAVYASNTVGAIFGSLGVAFVLIPWLGMQGSLQLLVGLNLVLAWVLGVAAFPQPVRRAVAAVAIGGVAVAVLGVLPDDLFRRTFSGEQGELVFYREGSTDTVGVLELGRGEARQRVIVYDDLRGTAGTPSVGPNHFQGHLPFLLHPGEPRKALHIGFGVGNSLAAVASHEELERVDSVELSPNAIEAAPYFWTNEDVLSNPRVRSIIADGRTFVMTSRESYDLIVMEPPETYTAGVVNLYTREFYEDAADRLAPGGLLVQWLFVGQAEVEHERMLLRAFHDVLPEASLWKQGHRGGLLLVGSKGPFAIDYARLRQRLREGPAQRDLAALPVVDADHLLSFFVLGPAEFAELVRDVPPVTEDRTVVDFSMPRYAGSGYGFGLMMWVTGRAPKGTSLGREERLRHYLGMRRPAAPLLVNTAGESAAAIQARIDARRSIRPVNDYPPSEERWKRWRAGAPLEAAASP